MTNENDNLGVIHFESFAEIVLPMTQVKNSINRKKITDKIVPSALRSKKKCNVWNGNELSNKKYIILLIQ